MHWFQGNIAEAVAKSKALNAVFIVFVEGTDDMSRDLAGVLEATDVAVKLGDQNKFLAVRLSSTDENYTHFAQIYKFVPVPSVFFIGRDGSPLEVVCAGITADKIVQRIDKILELHYNKISSADLTSSEPTPGSSTTSASASASLIQAESSSTHMPAAPPSQNLEDVPSSSKPASKQNAEYEIVCDGDVCTRILKQPSEQKTETTPSDAPAAAASTTPATTAASTTSATSAVSTTSATSAASVPPATSAASVPTATSAAVEAAVAAVPEAARVAVEAADAEARLKRAQELIEAKRREKEAVEKELEKQRELERRAAGQGVAELKRWQREQELKEAAEERRRERQANAEARQRVLEQIAQDRAERHTRHAAPAAPAAPATPLPAPSSSATVARLQLKTADGASHVVTFAPHDTMADVYAYVRQHALVGTSSFAVWTAFPRRSLAPDTATLASLGLAPSAALLLLPTSDARVGVPAPAATLYSFITTLFSTLIVQPVVGVWSWISARVFPPPARPSAPPARDRPAPADGLRYRAGGNVHRLREDDADDDDNNTWNGNSTQQM